MDTNSTPLIDTSHAAFITRGISISVSSCGADLMPSVARAIGCRVSTDRHSVTVLVSKSQAAELLAQSCDVMLVVGTSGAVYPAAGLAGRARRAGAQVVIVNPEPSEIDDEAHVLLRGTAAHLLPLLLDLCST